MTIGSNLTSSMTDTFGNSFPIQDLLIFDVRADENLNISNQIIINEDWSDGILKSNGGKLIETDEAKHSSEFQHIKDINDSIGGISSDNCSSINGISSDNSLSKDDNRNDSLILQEPEKLKSDMRIDIPIHFDAHDEVLTDFLKSPTREKSMSLSLLDSFLDVSGKTQRERPASFHGDPLKLIGGKNDTDDLLSLSCDSLESPSKESETESSSNIHGSSLALKRFKNVVSKETGGHLFRKAVSLCELQNRKLKNNYHKFEKRFLSNEILSPDADSTSPDIYPFPSLSYEDCSSCVSCRSRSSSYHSLLYDYDTASNYQIYQPTVCDVTSDTIKNDIKQTDERSSNENLSQNVSEKKDISSKNLFKQSHDAFGSFKDRFKKVKSFV